MSPRDRHLITTNNLSSAGLSDECVCVDNECTNYIEHWKPKFTAVKFLLLLLPFGFELLKLSLRYISGNDTLNKWTIHGNERIQLAKIWIRCHIIYQHQMKVKIGLDSIYLVIPFFYCLTLTFDFSSFYNANVKHLLTHWKIAE